MVGSLDKCWTDGAGTMVVSECVAKHRSVVLRLILELYKKGEPISAAIGDAS